MKYIDADHLKAKIRHLKIDVYDEAHQFDIGARSSLTFLESFIDSLQQEQPDFPTTDEQMKEFLATHPKIKVPEKYKKPDWLFKKQEQPEVHLNENTMKKEFHMIDSACLLFNYDKLSREQLIAQRFYQLGLKSK